MRPRASAAILSTPVLDDRHFRTIASGFEYFDHSQRLFAAADPDFTHDVADLAVMRRKDEAPIVPVAFELHVVEARELLQITCKRGTYAFDESPHDRELLQ